MQVLDSACLTNSPNYKINDPTLNYKIRWVAMGLNPRKQILFKMVQSPHS